MVFLAEVMSISITASRDDQTRLQKVLESKTSDVIGLSEALRRFQRRALGDFRTQKVELRRRSDLSSGGEAGYA